MNDVPESIGPFKVDSVIGSGSCGRVLKAFDQRLSRWVAIKLLYSFQDQTIEQEARLLASINHPNIVGVYDIIEGDDQQWTALVMEYLPGNTLKKVLAAGQMISLEVALGYCIEIAKGLSAAHQLGIIHRDLKPENIFLDSENHLKIGDFGIAKIPGEAALCPMLGSFCSVSPEQVLGKELSPQSDLFSLGLLLYQMLAGHHPFDQGDGPDLMLERLIDDSYPPLTCDSESVTSLVAGLLAKTPAHRYNSAQEVVDKIQQILDLEFSHFLQPTLKQDNPLLKHYRATKTEGGMSRKSQWLLGVFIAAALGSIALWALLPSKPYYVAVLKPVVHSGEWLEDIPLVQASIFQAATQAINEIAGNWLVASDEIDNISATSESMTNIINLTAANEVLFTQLDCQPRQCAVTFSRWQGRPATLISQHSIQIPIAKLLFVADYVQNYISGVFDEDSQTQQTQLLISEADYRQFLTIEFRHQQGEISLSKMITELEILNELRCDFEALCQLLLRSYLKKFRFERKPAWLERARELITSVNKDSSKLLLLTAAVEVEMAARDFPKADHWLQQLEREHLTDDTVLSLRARWYFKQGYIIKGKSIMAELVAQRPSVQHQFNYALMLYQLDLIEQSLAVLEPLLEQFPDYIRALELQAVLLFFDGQWHKVISAYQHLIAMELGENPHTQSNIGLAYLMELNIATALLHFKNAAQMAPNNPLFILNLADTHLLSGSASLAHDNYKKVIKLIGVLNNKTADDYLVLAQAYAQLKQRKNALTALLMVLKTNSENRFVLYNIGLIYLLVGDTLAAIDYLEQAVAAGLTKNWLRLPWFNVLSDNQRFSRLL